jgi:hypothetical protein
VVKGGTTYVVSMRGLVTRRPEVDHTSIAGDVSSDLPIVAGRPMRHEPARRTDHRDGIARFDSPR